MDRREAGLKSETWRPPLRGCPGEDAWVGMPGRGADLDGGDLWRETEATVVSVRHDDAADEARADAPGCLMHKLLGVALVHKRGAERLGKVHAQVVAGAGLHAPPR